MENKERALKLKPGAEYRSYATASVNFFEETEEFKNQQNERDSERRLQSKCDDLRITLADF